MPTVVIENTVKANPVPKDILYETSLSAIEREKESRAKRTLEETTAKHRASHPPDLATAHRPSHIEQLKMEAMIAEKEATTIKHHARPVPAYIYTNTDMIETNNNDSINKAQAQALIIPKQTTTTILREELLYRRQQEEKLAELSKYEHELRDANDFHQWQIEMRERDEQQRMAEIEARKEEMARAAEDAKAAMIKQQQLNAQHAATLKEEARQRIAQAEQEAEKEIQSKRQQAIMIAKEKEQIAISQAAIVVKKKALAAQELAIKEQHQAEVEKQKQDELKQRRELIRQIQAMEKLASVKAKKPKEVDVTTTSGLGLLSEMSIIELHARIELLQQQQRDQRDAKRDAILKYKQEKKEILENMARQHVRLRKAAIVKGAQERKEIKAEREAAIQAKQIEEEKEHAAFAEKMSAQRDAKRLEALKLAKELKEKRLRATFYANEKLELAKKREQDLLLAKKREEVTSLSKLTAEEKQAAITAAIDEQDRQRAATRVKQEKEYAQKRYDAHVKAMRRENIATQEEDLALKQTQARYVREREEETIAAIHKQQPWLKPKEQDSTLDRTRIRKSTGTLSSTTSIPSKTLTRTSRSSTTSPTQLPVPAV